MGRELDDQSAPVHVEVGVVARFLGQCPDPLRHGQRSGEVAMADDATEEPVLHQRPRWIEIGQERRTLLARYRQGVDGARNADARRQIGHGGDVAYN